MRRTEFVEFYITNVCNLSCDGCNRFNNLNLTGHENWSAHKSSYENFLKHVRCESISVLGGEPLMHPMINNILRDLRKFFPTRMIKVVTNGLLIHKVKGFWQTVCENNIKLDINIHNHGWRLPVYNNLVNLIGGKVKLNWMRDPHGFRAWFEHEGVKHDFTLSEKFTQNALSDPQGKLTPYNSDREKAWQACYSKCPTIAEGKFFKCPVSHCMPVAVRQRNDIDYTESQKELIDSFPFIKCEDIQNIPIDEFNAFVYNSIKQCRLCPEKFSTHNINEQKISKNYF